MDFGDSEVRKNNSPMKLPALASIGYMNKNNKGVTL